MASLAPSNLWLYKLLFTAFLLAIAVANDPPPLQDFCVADLRSPILVNGFVCKNPAMVTANDFLFKGLNIPGNTTNPQGFVVTPVFVQQLPGLNTLGVAVARLDYAPFGVNPPHFHPRATEVLTLLKGTLFVGFVTSNPENILISTILKKGDVFVFPQGLIHFQQNIGDTPAVALAAFSSQNPGLVVIETAVFGANPPIPEKVLERAFLVGKEVIRKLEAPFEEEKRA